MNQEAIERIQSLDVQIKHLQSTKKQIEAELLLSVDNQVKDQLGDKEYGCGTANIQDDVYNVKVVVRKKVKWDQEQLELINLRILASGADPQEYIAQKFSVSETSYKGWTQAVKEIFEPARTVEQTNPTITIEEKK